MLHSGMAARAECSGHPLQRQTTHAYWRLYRGPCLQQATPKRWSTAPITATPNGTIDDTTPAESGWSETSGQPHLQDSRSQTVDSALAPPRRGASRHRPGAASNLLGILLESAAVQAAGQVQTTVQQFQQTANKLTKGLRPRPPGYPPGNTAPSHTWIQYVASSCITSPRDDSL